MADIGEIAPDFTLPDDAGNMITLSALKPAPVVLFFYPRDNTPGCTTEAKDFTALADDFTAAGARVFGISADSLASHDKFRDKHALGIPLLSDEEAIACSAYGVWKEKNMYGKKFMGIVRATFVIGSDGRIAAAWPKVKVAGHAAEVLQAVQAL